MRQILRQGRAQIGIKKTAAADNPAQRGQGCRLGAQQEFELRGRGVERGHPRLGHQAALGGGAQIGQQMQIGADMRGLQRGVERERMHQPPEHGVAILRREGEARAVDLETRDP